MTHLERHMQHKRLQGVCTKIVNDTVKLREGYVEQMWLQVYFESGKCSG